MKRVLVNSCASQLKKFLLVCLLTLLMAFVAQATEQQDESDELEALFEFLGSFEDEPDEWNEFFEMATDGLPPEFEEDENE